jgi:hypothetical protein
MEAVMALRKLSPFERNNAWAEASHEQARTDFLRYHHLTETRGYSCLYRLTGGRCPHGTWKHCMDTTRPHHLPGGDHISLWSREGKPVLYVSQPYRFDRRDVEILEDLRVRFGWVWSVSTGPAWHYPGQVFFVEVWASPQARDWRLEHGKVVRQKQEMEQQPAETVH